MWIVCQADDSHEMPSLFSKNNNNNNKKKEKNKKVACYNFAQHLKG